MKKIILLSIFLLTGFYVVGQGVGAVVILNQGKEVINIGNQVYLLEDKEGTLGIEDILKPAQQTSFKKSE